MILSGLPVGEIRSLEEGGSAIANPISGAEMVANHNKPHHGFARV